MVEESVKMIKSAFIIQPESNQDLYVKSTFKSFFFSPVTVFILYFFLKFVGFFPMAQLAIKTRYYIII